MCLLFLLFVVCLVKSFRVGGGRGGGYGDGGVVDRDVDIGVAGWLIFRYPQQ